MGAGVVYDGAPAALRQPCQHSAPQCPSPAVPAQHGPGQGQRTWGKTAAVASPRSPWRRGAEGGRQLRTGAGGGPPAVSQPARRSGSRLPPEHVTPIVTPPTTRPAIVLRCVS